MSLVASGHHYIRDGMGTEKLYDLRIDRFEQKNLAGSRDSEGRVHVFRKMLLEVLTENKGSAEVEQVYLERYRQQLESLVENGRSDQLGGG